MPSGTQGYEITSGSITESLIDRFRKRKNKDKDEKKSGSGKGGSLAPTGGGGGGVVPASVSVVTPNQKLLVSGQANLLSAGSSAIVPTDGGAITKYDDKLVEVNVKVLEEQRKQTKLIAAQTQLLALAPGKKGGALAKFSKQESELEEIEDLSGTQGYARAKKPKWMDFLSGLLDGILSAIKELTPIILQAAAIIAGAMAARKLAGALADALRVVPVRVREMPRAALPPAAAVRGALPPAAAVRGALSPARARPALPPAVSPTAKLLPERTTGSALAVRTTPRGSTAGALPPGQGQAFKPEVKPQTRVLETVDVDRGNFKGTDRRFEALRNKAQRATGLERDAAINNLKKAGADVNVRPATPAIPKPKAPDIPTRGLSNAAGTASDVAGALPGGGAKYLLPGATAITAGLSLMAGDYAGAIVDAADATGDAIMVSGATGATAAVGTALSSAAAVIGAGITSSYVGEMTRGVGDWIRGDGNNMALNMASGIVEGLSGALETIGAPFRAIWEFVNSGFNMEKSNEVMAEIDSNLRESFRQGLNMFDALNIIPDEKGAFGTLGLYGDSAKRADAKMRGEGEVKNASGGSYFLDNPSNFGPFQGGEAGGEVVTFTPFGGRKLVNEMGKHMVDALQAPFQFAIGGIAVAVDKVINMLGPIGNLMKTAIGPKLQDLVKASGLTNLNLSAVSSQGGLGPLGSLFSGVTDMLGGLGLRIPGITPRSAPLGGGGNSDVANAPDLKTAIRRAESGNDYSSMYARDRGDFSRGREDITKMTIDQVHDLQTDYLRHQASKGYDADQRSAAMGAYQMMEVRKVAQSMGIDTSKTLFDKATQDRMSDYYLNYAGFQEYKAGKITAEQFNDRLAGQFASLKTTGGGGAYDNDGMNNAYASVLGLIRAKKFDSPAPQPQTSRPPSTTSSVMLPRIQAAAKEKPEMAALARIMEMNQAAQQRSAQPQQSQSGGLGANPFVMPLTDPNAANLAPLTLFKLSQ